MGVTMYKKSIVIVYYNYHKNVFKKYCGGDEAFHEDYLDEEVAHAVIEAVKWCIDNHVQYDQRIFNELSDNYEYTKEGNGELLYIYISM